MGLIRRLVTIAVSVLVGAVGFTAGPAAGVVAPVVNPALAPAPGLPARPPEATRQRAQCARPVLTGPPPHTTPAAQSALDLPRAWQFSRGSGQIVAVIDTGVNRHPRLPVLIPGGDYVSTSDGTVDCDGHGTLVAGIIAARPGPDDGFAGVAPDAAILSIRQLSLEYEAQNYDSHGGAQAMSAGGFGNVWTLAEAIVHAVDLGATVINISEVACAAVGTDLGDGALGGAVDYAYNHNVVVVAAAGNVQSDGACKAQNPGTGWNGVQTVATPAWYSPYLLTVAAVDAQGQPSPFSLAGPWVSVAAPGTDLYSLDSALGAGGLVNGMPAADGPPSAINGTSFASAFVAGVVALVRSRFPGLSAREVIDRIIRTAHDPAGVHSDQVGYGIVDPVGALTAQLPPAPVSNSLAGQRLAASPAAPAPDLLPRRIALFGALACVIALGMGTAMSSPFRRNRRRKLTEGVDY
ncbi:type VII secretion-associated serine protease mycosin [Nocardia alni]|uniref:type VII secretion-associated serine protease mycosin n=1 Tax=Nocardia alni TaxID=2815723 RepID=UPI0027E07BB6|nr:type VII secretion-associated serine protease mycosin [Nocardia alni]